MRDGTAIRSQLQLPVVMVSGLDDRDRGSKGRSATVDCCSSDLSVPDGKQGTIFARGTSVSSHFCVSSRANAKPHPRLLEFGSTFLGSKSLAPERRRADLKEFKCLRSISL
jgi:hypothetical protein